MALGGKFSMKTAFNNMSLFSHFFVSMEVVAFVLVACNRRVSELTLDRIPTDSRLTRWNPQPC